MTAPALNPAQFGPAGLNAAANAKASPANGALAGFEALMAALFPSADAAAAPAVSAPAAASPAPTVDPLLVVTTDVETPDGEAEAADTSETSNAAVDAATAALVAETAMPAAPVADAPKAAATEAAAAPPAQLDVDPRAMSPDAAAPVPSAESAVSEETSASTSAATAPAEGDETPPETSAPPAKPDLPKLPEAAAKPLQPPAWGQDKAPGAPAAPALANANPHANLAAKAAVATGEPAPETAEAPAAIAEDQARAAAPPAPSAKAETAPAQTSSRGAKTERGKAGAETAASPDAPAAAVADAPTEAKARDIAVRTAPQAPVEAVERKVDDAKPAADIPDFTVQSETRASGSSSSAPAETAAHPVRGAPETVANLAAQIIKKLDARTTRFDVELDPHGLGKVDVRVEIGANGRITAAMTFDNPQAAQDVKARANELQRALEQAGFDLQGGALSFDVAQDRGHGGQGRAWQDQQNETGNTFRGQAFRAALETAGDAADAANQGALRLSRGVRAGLDVRI